MTTPSASVPDQPDTAGTVDSAAAVVGDPRSLTLSEERLQVATELAAAGSVRLEKYLVTETRSIDVQVSCERLRLVFTGPDGAENVVEDPPATFQASSMATDSTRWMFLHEEQPVVTTQWVPVERIRLDKYWIAGNEIVTEDVRAEHLDMTTDPAVTGEESDTRS